MNLTEALLRRSGAVGDAPGAEVRVVAKACLLDWLGVAIAGAEADEVGILVREALADGGGRHPLIARGERVALRDAVLINGTASHVLDYDDGLPAMSGHASVAILPALLGIAERRQVNGEELLRGLVVGAEMAGCLGTLVAPSHYERGFHATATVGAVAAASGCARLLGLDDEAAGAAMGLAAVRAGGLKAAFGTPAKPLQVGWAALVGYTAACWAEGGMVAPADAIGGPQGFAAAESDGAALEAALAPAPGGAHILDTRFKRYASCGVTHALLDALAAIGSARPLDAGELLELKIGIGRGADRICNIAAPATGLEAKFSLRAVAAMHLLGADLADPASFSDAAFRRLDPARLYERISIELVDDWPATRTQVRLRTADGWRQHLQDGAARPADGAECLRLAARKFNSLARPRLGVAKAERLHDMILGLETQSDASELAALSSIAGGRAAAIAG